MSVRIRMKRMGRAHQPYFRICAIDRQAPNRGRVLEELGTYDPRVPDTDARAILKTDRVDYWLSVGAQPSEKVSVLIKKYGTKGTHAEAQQAALVRMAQPKTVPDPGPPAASTKSRKKAEAAEAPAETAEAPAEAAEAPAEAAEGAGDEEPAAVAAGAESDAGAEE